MSFENTLNKREIQLEHNDDIFGVLISKTVYSSYGIPLIYDLFNEKYDDIEKQVPLAKNQKEVGSKKKIKSSVKVPGGFAYHGNTVGDLKNYIKDNT